jgi:hypothetical protein
MQLTLDSHALEKFLEHAASAASPVGHLDGAIADVLGDRVEAVVHAQSEILVRTRALAEDEPARSADHEANDRSPTLTICAGDAS